MSPKARNWLLIVAVVGIIALLRFTTSRAIEPTNYFDAPKPMVIAHQGGAALRPGNTMLAFEHAVGLGVDVLEMDLHLSADAVPVVIHDATLDRTTDGVGPVAARTAAQLKRLDAAYRWPFDGTAPYRGRGLTIPTLEEVLVRFPGQRVNLEIKHGDATTAARVCAIVTDQDARARVLVASFDDDTVLAFRGACPGAATSATSGEVMSFYVHQWLGIERLYHPLAHALQVPPEARGVTLADPRLFTAARARGMHVDVWTVNERDAMRRLVDARVGGIITDRPDVLLDVLGRLP